MNSNESQVEFSFFKFLFLTLVFIIYSNSFQASWHFDDAPNILDNENAHVSNLTWSQLYKSMHNVKGGGGGGDKEINRPVSRVTLGINWYFGQNNVFGYHVVNFVIHAISGWVLFRTLLLLFSTPILKKYDHQTVFFCAALTAVIWAVHPIQSQAVTYIVQRMASLAGMFYILGIFFYLRARLESQKSRQWVNAGFCCFAYFFAVGSKQNAIMLPASFILIEIVFFQAQLNFLKNRFFYFGCILFVLLVVLLLLNNQIPFLQDLYSKRNFTLNQRLLTESRILIFYLTQLFYPVETRFSIEHDIDLSHSLFDPISTIIAVSTIMLLIILSFWYRGKWPLLSFAILFYFLNHLVESTIIPLELVFEHRNYIPSMFIFLPVAFGINAMLCRYKNQNKTIYLFLFLFIPGIIIFTGLGTYARNFTWQTNELLWQDAMEKAPGRSRPYQNYSVALAKSPKANEEKTLTKIFDLNQTALKKTPSGIPIRTKRVSFENMAASLTLQKKYDQAILYYEKILEVLPGHSETLFQVAKLYLVTGDNQKALERISSIKSENEEYLNLYSLVLIKNKMPEKALEILKKIRKRDTKDSMLTLVHLGSAYIQKREYKIAKQYLNSAIVNYPNSMLCYLLMLDVCERINDVASMKDYGKKILDKWSIGRIQTSIDTMKKEKLQPDIPFDELLNFLYQLVSAYYAKEKTIEVAAGIRSINKNVWFPIDDDAHRPLHIDRITVENGVIIVYYTFTAEAIHTFMVTPDEMFTRQGYLVGASVGLNKAAILVSQMVNGNVVPVDVSNLTNSLGNFWIYGVFRVKSSID